MPAPATLTVADLFASLPRHRLALALVAGFYPVVAAFGSDVLKSAGKRHLSLFVADFALLLALLAVCLEAAALHYYYWQLGGDPIRDLDIVVLLAAPVMLVATVALVRFVHPLGALATVRRLKSFAALLALSGVLFLVLLRTRIWIVFYGQVFIFLALLGVLLYFIYWYFRRFLQAA